MTTNATLSRRSLLGLFGASAAVLPLAACSTGTAAGSTSSHILSTTVITKVYGDGQKVAAIAVQYDAAIRASSLSPRTFTVTGHTVTAVRTNDRPALTTADVAGAYAIVELSTAKINPGYTLQGGGDLSGTSGSGGGSSAMPSGAPSSGTGGAGGKPGGMPSGGTGGPMGGGAGGGGFGSTTPSNRLAVTLTQTGEVRTSGGATYAATAALKTDYKKNVNLVVDDFTQHTYTDSSTGDTLLYNLFTPKTQTGRKYPLVLFMPDATAISTDPVKTLTQGLGAVVWADGTSQTAHPAFVLAPQYTGKEKDDKADTFALLRQLLATQPIDPERVYVTGQSAGTIRAISMMIDQPDLFGGAMLVAGQADSGYTTKLAQLKDETMWMIAATGDVRALPGMTAIQKAVTGAGTTVTKGTWSATLSTAQQDADAESMAKAATHVKFTVLSHVVPSGAGDSDVNEHLNTWRVAYSIPEIREWLFQQKR